MLDSLSLVHLRNNVLSVTIPPTIASIPPAIVPTATIAISIAILLASFRVYFHYSVCKNAEDLESSSFDLDSVCGFSRLEHPCFGEVRELRYRHFINVIDHLVPPFYQFLHSATPFGSFHYNPCYFTESFCRPFESCIDVSHCRRFIK